MMLNAVLSGAISTAAMVAALFFLRYWRATRDRFFLFFAIAFALESVSRFLIGAMRGGGGDETPAFYLLRLAAYTLILVAIVDKNRRAHPPE